MKIFVTGASGYIGEELCLGLRRAGHKVYGLVRDVNKESSQNLGKNEVTLVVGSLEKADSWHSVARDCDVLIHAASDYTQFSQLDRLATESLLTLAGSKSVSSSSAASSSSSASTSTSAANQKQAAVTSGSSSSSSTAATASASAPVVANVQKMVIYTSGCLCYPDKPNTIQFEADQAAPAGLLKDRADHEQLVLSDPNVCGVVIRPSFVFGKKSTHFVGYFAQAHEKGSVTVVMPDVSWSEVHIDDLVDLYVRVVEAPHSTVKAQIFNAADLSRNTNREIAKRFAAHVGLSSVVEDTKTVREMANKTTLIDCSKARRLLGWIPKHALLFDEIDVMYAAWKARFPLLAARPISKK